MANKKRLVAFPFIEELQYRQKINSKQLNTMFQSIEESVLRSIIRGTEVSETVNSLNTGVISSYNALKQHNQSFNKYPIQSGAFASSFDDVTQGDVAVRQDVMAGISTMDWTKENMLSKIPRVDGEVSPNVSVLVDDVARAPEDHVYNTLNRDHSSFWIEQITPAPTSKQQHTLELQLPPSVNKKFNYIELVPFPIFGMEITRVTYNDLRSVERDIFNTETKPYPFYNNSGPLVLHVQPREFNNSIKIYYNVIPGVDVMGFSSIDVGLIDYTNTPSTVYIPFKNIDNSVTNIQPSNVELDFHIEGVAESSYDSYFKSGISIVNSIGGGDSIDLKITRQVENYNTSIDASSGLWLRVSMNEVNMTTAMFRGCKFNY